MTKKLAAKFQEDKPRPRTETLAITEITCDPEILPRPINIPVVLEYAESMKQGAQFPPVDIIRDGDAYLLVSGLQRLEAAKRCGRKSIQCSVRRGDRRAAILASVSVNATHGLRRTNEDKRWAVAKLLDDPEWKKWSAREIARRCCVSPTLVADMQAERAKVTAISCSEQPREVGIAVSPDGEQPRDVNVVTYTDKHGNEARMSTANIGRSPAEHLAFQRRQYFRESIDRLHNFKEYGVYDDPNMAVDILRGLNTRDGLARVLEAANYIRDAIGKFGPRCGAVEEGEGFPLPGTVTLN